MTEDTSVESEDDPKIFLPDILKSFRDAETENKLIGLGGEKIGVDYKTGETAAYSGKNGFLAILGKMYEELGWEITKQQGRSILQMKRGKTIIDLESDGRIELAGSPQESIHDLAREFRIHQNEITEISNMFGINWLGTGYHPISKNEEIEDIDEDRKQEMNYFFSNIKEKTGNDFGLAWYKKTAGVQVNLDYSSEADFSRKGKLLFQLAPFLTAMFANSPFSKGENTGFCSYRQWVANQCDIPRFSMPQALYESDFSYEDWVNNALSLQMIFINKGNKWIRSDITFGEYLTNGYKGFEATMADFDMHMKSVWMDIRLRKTIEIRCVDSLPPHMVPSFPALIKGLVYSEEGLVLLEETFKDMSYTDYKTLLVDAAKNGLQAEYKEKPLLHYAKLFLEQAEKTLKEEAILDVYGKDESIYLKPIKEFVFVKGKSPAEWLADNWENTWNKEFSPVYEWTKY